MYEEKPWSLDGARALVHEGPLDTRVTLSGIVTARAFELLHQRLTSFPRRRRLILSLGIDATFVITCQSAVEAAVRGTPDGHTGLAHAVLIEVPPARVSWSLKFQVLMGREGLVRVTLVDRRPAALAAETRVGHQVPSSRSAAPS